MYLLFDIGGTKTRIAFSSDGESFEDPEIFQTPELFDDGINKIEKAIKKVSKERKIEMVCGGIAGSLSKDKTQMLVLPNIKKWEGRPLVERLKKICDAPVILENDSALVGLGEAVYGAGKSFDIVSYITVSTGVGGVRVVDGKIDKNRWGFEPGHQVIDFEEAVCEGCDKGGTISDHISGTSIEKRTGKKPEDITDEGFWDEASKVLAYGLNNVIVFWSPDIVVLGGSIMNEPGISIEKTKEYLDDILKIFPEQPEIKKASLEDLGALWGALAQIKNLKI